MQNIIQIYDNIFSDFQKIYDETLTYIFIIEFYSLLPFLSNQIFAQYLFLDLFLYFAHTKILLSCYLKRTNVIEYICVNMSRGFK